LSLVANLCNNLHHLGFSKDRLLANLLVLAGQNCIDQAPVGNLSQSNNVLLPKIVKTLVDKVALTPNIDLMNIL
jgi:hypothetical protein